MTNSELITRLRAASQDTDSSRPERSATTLAQFLTDAQDLINSMMELCRKAFTMTLVASTRSYSVDADFVAFVEERLRRKGGCVYYSTGNLEPTTPQELDQDESGWRNASNGTPEKFFLETSDSSGTSVTQIGLDTPPSATFITNVPSLTYYGVKRPTAIASNSNLPFDNNPIFQPLHRLLILHAMFSMDLEDGKLAKPDARESRWNTFLAEVEAAGELMPGNMKAGGGFKFDRKWRT